MADEIMERAVDRRRLLRRAGTVAATVAGAGAVGAAMGSPAAAAPGDPVAAGATTSAGTLNTRLENSSSANPTLTLANAAESNEGGFLEAGPQLRLEPNGDYVLGPVGSLGVSVDGTLWTSVPALGGGTAPDFVRTGANSTIVQSFAPVRILDTRTSSGRAGVLNKSVIDSGGYLRENQTLHLSLDSLFVWAWTIFANITVIPGEADGKVLAWPSGQPKPAQGTNVNWIAKATIGNFAAISVGSTTVNGIVADNAISVFTNKNARIVIDIAGAVVNYPSDVISSAAFATAEAGSVRTRPARTMPPRA